MCNIIMTLKTANASQNDWMDFKLTYCSTMYTCCTLVTVALYFLSGLKNRYFPRPGWQVAAEGNFS